MSDALVATLAFAFAGVAVGFGIGPWDWPYELRTFARLRKARGMVAARLGWVVLAVVAAGCGAAILSDSRPFGDRTPAPKSRIG